MTTDGELIPTPAAPPEGPSAWLELSARLGDIGQGVQQLVSDGRQASALPMQQALRKGGTVAVGGGPLVIDMGLPAMGRRWSVRSLAVLSSAGPTGVLAGSANWYVGNPSAFGPGEWAAPQMTTLPAFQFCSGDQLNITPTDHLFCVITGGTAGQSAMCRAYVLDFPQYAGSPTIQL